MATPKAAKNAGEAAARAASRADAPSGRGNNIDWVARANDLRIDTVAAKQLDTEFIPELEAAGYPNSVIKDILAAEDPHLAAKQFIADERAALTDALSKTNYGLTPEQIARTNLRDLKETVADAVRGGDRPSGIRGKTNEVATTETRLPDENTTATADAELAAVPKEPAAGGKDASAKKEIKDPLKEFLAQDHVFTDPANRGTEGFFQANVAGPSGDFRSVAVPGGGLERPIMVDTKPAPRPTPSMEEIDRSIRGVPAPKGQAKKPPRPQPLSKIELDAARAQVNMADPGQQANLGNGAIVVSPGVGNAVPIEVVDATTRRAPASPSVQPAPKAEVDTGAQAASRTPASAVVEAAKNDPIVRGVGRLVPTVKQAFQKYPVASSVAAFVGAPVAAATVRYGVPMAYRGVEKLYGFGFGGGQQPAPSQQAQQPQQGGVGAQINILPREALQRLERGPAAMPAMPPAMPQAPAPAPVQGPPGREKTTDIIRRLSGRMA